MFKVKLICSLLAIALLGAVPALAVTNDNDHYVGIQAGPLIGFGTRTTTYTWSFYYMEGISEHWAWSITKLNEGHDDNNHMDGSALQLWARTSAYQRKLTLAAGLGPQFYCDTVPSTKYDEGYEDNHGLGLVLSALARWRLNDVWWVEVRGNGVVNDNQIRTAGLLLGVGRNFESSWTGESIPAGIKLNEATVLGGMNIVNNFGSPRSGAACLEYRRYLLPWLNATLSAIHEGKTALINRNGVAPQIWWGKHFADGHLSFGFGAGPYLAYDSCREDQPQLSNNFAVSALLSYTAAYHFDSGALLRATWHRVATKYDYNRDTDIILLGVGCGF